MLNRFMGIRMTTKKIGFLIALMTMLFSQPGVAEVYRCKENGKTIYSGVPCGNNETKLEISSTRSGDRYSSDKERRRLFLLKNKDIKPVYRQAIEAGVVIPGMTEKQALASLGTPTKRNLSQGDRYSSWQWVYESPTGQRRYVYLANGIVTGTN